MAREMGKKNKGKRKTFSSNVNRSLSFNDKREDVKKFKKFKIKTKHYLGFPLSDEIADS